MSTMKKGNTIGAGIIIALAIVVIGLSQSIFTVHQTQQAIVLEFGNPQSVITQSGLHFKVPFVQTVRFFDKRILSVDPPPERVILRSDTDSPLRTKVVEEIQGEDGEDIPPAIVEVTPEEVSGEPILVNTFARYRITDSLLFLQRLATEDQANNRIESVMNSATRDVLGKTTLRSLLSREREDIMRRIRDQVNAEMGDRGVEIVDIRIVRADLTDRLRNSTVQRMITERQERAAETRAKGQALAKEIRAGADKRREILLAEAGRDAQIIRGEGDNTSIATYANAFNKDPDFYDFIRSMEAYENTLGDEGTQYVLSPKSEFLRFFEDIE